MASSDQLRRNKRQHKPKNALSKGDDKAVAQAMDMVIAYLEKRMNLKRMDYYLQYVKSIELRQIMQIIRSYDKRTEFAVLTKETSNIKPDGGILMLRRTTDDSYKRIALVVEMKRQGTNDQRRAEGKKKQAAGNAIERLGKNLIGFRSTLQYEDVTPFVCFGWGVDFDAESSINDRVITMNEFYPLNRIFVFKREGYSPVSMFFRAEKWKTKELFEIMKEVAETSIRYYVF
jgi:type II restriction enzyme